MQPKTSRSIQTYHRLNLLSLAKNRAASLSAPVHFRRSRSVRSRYRALRLRSLSEQTRQITSRAGGGHALPLHSSAKTFDLCVIEHSCLGKFSGVESSWAAPFRPGGALPSIPLSFNFAIVVSQKPVISSFLGSDTRHEGCASIRPDGNVWGTPIPGCLIPFFMAASVLYRRKHTG